MLMRFIHRANRTVKATLKLYSFHQVWVMQDVHIFIKCRASKGQGKIGTMKYCMKATTSTFTFSFAVSTIGLRNCPYHRTADSWPDVLSPYALPAVTNVKLGKLLFNLTCASTPETEFEWLLPTPAFILWDLFSLLVQETAQAQIPPV